MTLQGTVNKTGLSLLILLAAAGFVWNSAAPQPFIIVGLIGGLITALVTVFKKRRRRSPRPLYAAFEGLLLGGLSLLFEQRYPGIVINAVALTFGTLAVLLAVYSTGLIRPSENFKLGIFAATGAIGVLYLVSMVMGFFGKSIPFIHDSGPIGIAFSLFVVGLAALNLVLDFDFIERGRGLGRAEVHGMGRRLRPARHAGLAVHRDPAAAGEIAGPPAIRVASRTSEPGRRPWAAADDRGVPGGERRPS